MGARSVIYAAEMLQIFVGSAGTGETVAVLEMCVVLRNRLSMVN